MTNEVRSCGGNSYERQMGPQPVKNSLIWPFFRFHLRGMTHKTNCHLLNIQTLEATVTQRGSVAASLYINPTLINNDESEKWLLKEFYCSLTLSL